jgi:hypothetical protein
MVGDTVVGMGFNKGAYRSWGKGNTSDDGMLKDNTRYWVDFGAWDGQVIDPKTLQAVGTLDKGRVALNIARGQAIALKAVPLAGRRMRLTSIAAVNRIDLVAVSGRQLRADRTSETTWATPSLARGLYLVRLRTATGSVTRELMVQ